MSDGEASESGRPREDGATEVEATLVVASEAPADVAGELALLDRVGEFAVEWEGVEEHRDLYFDTEDGALGERGIGLRLRKGDGWTVTLKGEARPGPGGEVERAEVESDWSEAGLRRVLRELERRGAAPPGQPGSPAAASPPDVLRSAGLRVVQDRRTLRRTGRVRPRGGGESVAVLAVDTVLFRSRSGRTVRHREVEVEATDAAPPGLPGRLAGELRRRFGEELRPWTHGKLATGRALAELEPPTGAGGDLLPGAYELLERRLSGAGREG